MIYDYLIVGAGIGGLSAGLNLATHKKKTLILEKNSIPGGLVSTFKRGRFEFDTALYNLYDYGDDVHVGKFRELLKEFGIELETKIVPFNTRIKVLNPEANFVIRGEIKDFIIELERLKEGSIESLKEFMRITKEVHEAMELLKNHEPIDSSIAPNFIKYFNTDSYTALKSLGMPEETIDRLGFLWPELGSPLNKLSFIDFSLFMYKIIFKKNTILLNNSLNLPLKLAARYQELGGRIYYNSLVTEVTKNGKFYLVKTEDNLEYKAKHIIFDVSKRYVYENIIKNHNPEINRLENARTLSPNGVVVYLGLNRSPEELGLKNYNYYAFHTLNSAENVRYMTNLEHETFSAIVPNIMNASASPKNTTILVLKKMFFTDVFKNLNNQNYDQIKEQIAQNLITSFEETFKIDISEYIEEIAVATPVTFASFTNNVDGSFYGYMAKSYDNPIYRFITYPEEETPGFTFVGASSLFGAHVDNAFYSGYYLTEELLKNKEGK